MPLNSSRSMINLGNEIRLVVDLDSERGITPKEGRTPNIHHVVIRNSKPLDLSVIDHYLGGKMSFDNTVLEAISKLNDSLDYF